MEAKQNTTLEASAAMLNAAEYRNVIAGYRNGMPIRLSEIANVVDDVENQLGANVTTNERSIGLAIYKQSNANTIAIVDEIYDRCRATAPKFRRRSRWNCSPTARCRSAIRSRTCR